jgi:hypothetical protein
MQRTESMIFGEISKEEIEPLVEIFWGDEEKTKSFRNCL